MNLESTQANPDHSDCPMCNENDKMREFVVDITQTLVYQIKIEARNAVEAENNALEIIDNVKMPDNILITDDEIIDISTEEV